MRGTFLARNMVAMYIPQMSIEALKHTHYYFAKEYIVEWLHGRCRHKTVLLTDPDCVLTSKGDLSSIVALALNGGPTEGPLPPTLVQSSERAGGINSGFYLVSPDTELGPFRPFSKTVDRSAVYQDCCAYYNQVFKEFDAQASATHYIEAAYAMEKQSDDQILFGTALEGLVPEKASHWMRTRCLIADVLLPMGWRYDALAENSYRNQSVTCFRHPSDHMPMICWYGRGPSMSKERTTARTMHWGNLDSARGLQSSPLALLCIPRSPLHAIRFCRLVR